MGVDSAEAKMQRAAKNLLAHWEDTRQSWRDDVSQGFEDKHLRPLLAKLRAAEGAMTHMQAVLAQVRRDCS